MFLKRFVIASLFVVVTSVISLGLIHLPGAAAGDNEKAEALTKEQIQEVAAYVLQLLKQDPSRTAFEGDEIEKAMGFTIPEEASPLIQAEVMRLMAEAGIDLAGISGDQSGASCNTVGNRCTEYGACSLYGDLAGATGETLQMYAKEKALDGTEYKDFALPAFEAVDLAGNKVTSSQLDGQPTMLVLLAGHCGHSIGSIGILQTVAKQFKDKDVRVLGVFLNSGSREQVKTLVDLYKIDYDVWVFPDESLGEKIDTRLVPTYLFVDGHGAVKKKLVGMKDETEITEFLTGFME